MVLVDLSGPAACGLPSAGALAEVIPAEKDEVRAMTEPRLIIGGDTLTWIDRPGFSLGDGLVRGDDFEVGLEESEFVNAVVNTRGSSLVLGSGFSNSEWDIGRAVGCERGDDCCGD